VEETNQSPVEEPIIDSIQMSLKYVILGLLREEQHYGYEIKQSFEQDLEDIWPVSYGQLYPTLRKLAVSGHITMQTVPGKKAIDKNVYSITEKGKREFLDWFEKKTKKSQFSVKDDFTLFLFFSNELEREKLLPIVRKNLDIVTHQQVVFQNRLDALGKDVPYYHRALIKKMILHLEAERIWLEEIMMERRLSGSSPPA
jgi:DNA-binding PadR family transcriptional regulator